jgi:cytochrome c-type biogenesis protein
MDALVTFFEGVITFVSPCLLPLLPLYVAYFAGGADRQAQGGTRRTVVCAAGFVLGFGLLFTLMGAFAGLVGGLLLRYQRVLNMLCGLVIVVLGLNYLGVLSIGALNRTSRMDAKVMPRNFGTSMLFGMVFAIGWSPCVGTFLASALSMAASSASVLTGVGLLACYSLGLGLPFVVCAVLIDQLEGAFDWIKRHYDAVNRVSGVLLVALGVLMATGLLGGWLRLLAGM